VRALRRFAFHLAVSVVAVCGIVVPAGCAAPAAPTNEVVVGTDQFGTTIRVDVGTVISIPRPNAIETWQVDFGSPPLELLNGPDSRTTPGPGGWRFRASAVGETDIRLTPVTSGDANPPRFVVTIRVAA